MTDQKNLLEFLLSEADDEDTTDPQDSGAGDDDTKDTTSDASDTDTDAGSEDDTTGDDSSSDDSSTDDGSDDSSDSEDDSSGGDDAQPARKRMPSRFAIDVEDTPANRLFIGEQLEELLALIRSVLRVVHDWRTRSDGGGTPSISKAVEKIEKQGGEDVDAIELLLRDGSVASMDIGNLFGLLTLYKRNAQHLSTLLKSAFPPDPKAKAPARKQAAK
jgi:hypothetical protein